MKSIISIFVLYQILGRYFGLVGIFLFILHEGRRDFVCNVHCSCVMNNCNFIKRRMKTILAYVQVYNFDPCVLGLLMT